MTAALVDLFALLKSYELKIQQCDFTKSDHSYHDIKQSLHNIWAKIYSLEKSEDQMDLTRRIVGCLTDLDRKTQENEKKKYQNYYCDLTRNTLVGRL
ncbi:unnamed protein product [Callosobruchus maculatus]|uniref:Uncharacterized protein n=1 Tax=Callosobruchus maculatus TaxID=64391 RepID=A0A653CHM4_CALMS|nr:unnamed protein product [Callosobruchus maculatus]